MSLAVVVVVFMYISSGVAEDQRRGVRDGECAGTSAAVCS